ncbi:MAG: hypothetical protein ABI895_05840 [Deltaproteobacteria bacterium]
MRRTLLSDLPRSSDPPSEPAPASGVEEGGGDFARWLTHDLRAKGSPSQVPLAERPSQPPSVLIPVPEQAQLANWLMRDLRPRSSAPPDAGVYRESSLPLGSPTALESVPPSELLLAPDSLVPHTLVPDTLVPDTLVPDTLVPDTMSEAPLARAPALEPALDEDDLSVLPSRRGKGRERRRQALILLSALLGVAGLSLWLRSQGQAEATQGAGPAANVPLAAAPLPPPPPWLPEDTVEETAPLAPTATVRRSGAAADVDDGLEPGPRGRRAGDAVARFADLPLATQSKLAREERQKARARDARARARKAASSSLPP